MDIQLAIQRTWAIWSGFASQNRQKGQFFSKTGGFSRSIPDISSVSVLDITGKSISNTSFSKNKNNVTIDISTLDAGVYLVSVVLNDKVITKKIKVLN